MHHVLTWFAILALAFGVTGCLTRDGSSTEDSSEDLETSHGASLKLLTVWKIEPSAVHFSSGATQEMSFLVLAERDDVPFFCHVNGGEREPGGFSLKIPAHRDWKKLSFAIDVKKQRGLWLEIELAPECPVGRADFIYSIAPVEK